MYLKEKSSSHLVEIISLRELFDPFNSYISGRLHYGEEVQEPEAIAKEALAFPSNEPLPQCWLNAHYQDHEFSSKS